MITRAAAQAESHLRTLAWVVGLVAATLVAAMATREGMLLPAVGAIAAGLLLLVGISRPEIVAAVFAALIPLEYGLVLGPVGTASRVIAAIFLLSYLLHYRTLPNVRVMPIVGWAYLGWAVISAFAWTIWPSNSQVQVGTLVQLFVLAVFVGDVVARKTTVAKLLMWMYAAGAVVSVAVAVVTPPAGRATDTGRAAAFVGQDPAQFASILLPAFLFLVFEAVTFATGGDRAGRLRALALALGAAILAWAAVASGTRSALVGIGVGLLAFALLGIGAQRGRVAAIVVGSAAAAIALLAPGAVDSTASRIATAASSGGSGRTDIWAVGATIWSHNPLIGVGYGGFGRAYTQDMIEASGISGQLSAALTIGRGSHSIVVGTAAELGIVGVMLLGLFLWRVLTARSAFELSSFGRAALIGLLGQALFLDVVDRKQVWLVIGITVGLAAATRAVDTTSRLALAADRSARGERRSDIAGDLRPSTHASP